MKVGGFLAISALRAIMSRGLRIPEDVSVIAYMSDWVSDLATPRLSFIKQNLREIGSQTFKLLLSQMTGEDCVKHVIVKASLELRDSTRKVE